MRDFFEIDVNDVDHSMYKKFVTKSIGGKYQEDIEKADKEFKEIVNTTVAPKQKQLNVFYYLTLISTFLSLIFAFLLFQNIDEEKDFPYFHLIALIVSMILLVVFSLLQLKTKREYNKLLKSDSITRVSEKNSEIEEKLKNELGIPQDCEKIDVFVRQIYVKNNQVYNALRQSYNNYGLYAYKKNNKIIFSDTYEIIELKLSEVTKVKLINEKITFQNWNKKVPMSDPKFRPYKVRYMAKGGILVNCFYQIELKHGDVEYLIRIPGYEKDFIEQNFDNFELVVEGKKNENK